MSERRCKQCGKWEAMDADAYCQGHGQKMAVESETFELSHGTLDSLDAKTEQLVSAAINAQRRGFENLCFGCLEGFHGASCPRCTSGV